MQYFIGLKEFTDDRPFDSSTLVDFRKRLDNDVMERIIERSFINKAASDENDTQDNNQENDENDRGNKNQENENENEQVKRGCDERREQRDADYRCNLCTCRHSISFRFGIM